MSKYQFLTANAADPHIVKLFANHLIAAFEQFIASYPGKVDYVDGFMAAHNFHKAIVEHLVGETGDAIWHDMALATFQEAIERLKNEN
jgi:hypothetical protein